MSVLGPTPFAVILCKCSDQPQEPQSPGFFQAFFTETQWAGAFRISDPNMAPPGAPVAVVARKADHLDVFWAGNDGAIWTNWWDANANNGLWNTAFRISDPNVVPPGAGVAAVARHAEHLDVFWADDFRQIGTNYWPGPSPQGLAAYWRDISYGQVSWDGTQVFGWRTIGQNLASFKQLNRPQKIAACMAAFPEVNFGNFFSVIVIDNSISDSGSAGGKTILDPGGWILSLAAHETGHNYGLDHSFDDSQTSCDPGSDNRPGAYKDPWDIMSARCFAGQNPMFTGAFGQSGPGLNAPYRDKLGWIPSNRNYSVVAGNAFRGIMTLAD